MEAYSSAMIAKGCAIFVLIVFYKCKLNAYANLCEVKHFHSFSHVMSILYWLQGNSVRFGHKYNNGTIYINTNAMMYHLIVI
jgi:hypothetical protein